MQKVDLPHSIQKPDTTQTRNALTAEEKSRKALHKILLILLKAIPAVIAMLNVINIIAGFLGKECVLLSYIGGLSLLPMLFIYLASFVFGFCTYHRMFIYYVFVTNTLSTIDYTVGLPITNDGLMAAHCFLFGIFCFLVLHFYLKSKHAECYKETSAEDS